MDILEKKQDTVKKHSALIQISGNKMTASQRKLYTALIFSARESKILDPLSSRYSVKYSVLKELAGITAPNNSILHRQLEEMMAIVVRGNALEKDKDNRWSSFTILAGAQEADDHCLMYSFPHQVDDSLLTPSVYGVINLSVIRKLQSKYAVTLYELACDYRNVGTGYIDLLKLKEIFGIQKEEYKDFKDFNKKIIKASIMEIEKAGGGTIKAEFLKSEATVTHVRFNMLSKDIPSNQLVHTIAPDTNTERVLPVHTDIDSIKMEAIDEISKGKGLGYKAKIVQNVLSGDFATNMLIDDIVKRNDIKANSIVSQFKKQKLGGFITISDGTVVAEAQVVAVTELKDEPNKAMLVLNINGENVGETVELEFLRSLIV